MKRIHVVHYNQFSKLLRLLSSLYRFIMYISPPTEYYYFIVLPLLKGKKKKYINEVAGLCILFNFLRALKFICVLYTVPLYFNS